MGRRAEGAGGARGVAEEVQAGVRGQRSNKKSNKKSRTKDGVSRADAESFNL